jgi:hypothetical protein
MHTPKAKIVMWDVLSGDFDQNYSPEQCLENVLSNYERGSIVVFHDSEKAFANLKWVLPALLDHIAKEGFVCRVLKQEVLK